MISIVIPTYEQRGHGPTMLHKLLTSIATQKYDKQDYEIVITDNSMNKSIEELLARYFLDLPITYYRNTLEIGHCENFNYALDRAKGDYIKPMCMDDLFVAPTSLKAFHDALKIHPWVITNSYHIDQLNRIKYKKMVQYKPNEFEKNYTGMPSVVGWRRNELRFDTLLRTYCDLWLYRQLYDMYGEPHILRTFNVAQRFWNYSASRTLPSHHEADRKLIKERLNL